jgi:hypothetical protein
LSDGGANRFLATGSSLPKQVLEFGEDLLDRVQVGGVFWEQEQPAAGFSDGLADRRAFVAAEVVHDHQVAGLERRYQNLFDISAEPLCVDRTIQQPGRLDAVMSKCRDKGHRVPVAIRDVAEQARPARRPATQRGHVGLGPGLVDKDQTGRVNAGLIATPLRAAASDVGAILFAGEKGFFYS